MEFTAIGITDGIGSLIWGAKQIGFKILGNHEWRKYYDTGTFEHNFEAPYVQDYEVIDNSMVGVDLIASHAECGNFSNLYTGPNRDKRVLDPGDIWQFINLAQKYKPKFFLADNLVKSLVAVTPSEWRSAFPDYNITFEWVSNYHYGNTQYNRRRMFIVGSHKDLNYKFVPGEFDHCLIMRDVISDIPDNACNHQKMDLNCYTQWSGYQIGEKNQGRLQLYELQDWLSKSIPGRNMPYYNKKGELKSKPGYSIVRLDYRSPVLSGGGGFYDNHWIEDEEYEYYRPLTMRERLRIQGFPDNFILTPLKFEWGSKDHQCLIKQTGKCMPDEFPTYFAKQIKKFLETGELPESGKRLTKIPELIQEDMELNKELYYV